MTGWRRPLPTRWMRHFLVLCALLSMLLPCAGCAAAQAADAVIVSSLDADADPDGCEGCAAPCACPGCPAAHVVPPEAPPLPVPVAQPIPLLRSFQPADSLLADAMSDPPFHPPRLV